MAVTKGEDPLLSESKRAELNRIQGKIEKMEAHSYKLKDEKSVTQEIQRGRDGRRPLVLKSLNIPPHLEAPKTTKAGSPSKRQGDSLSKTVVNLSDTQYQRVA